MTASPVWTIWCDLQVSPLCLHWAAEEATAKDALQWAKDRGWKRRRGKDICPWCVKMGKTPDE